MSAVDGYEAIAEEAFKRWISDGFFTCWCSHCKPGWRNSKRDARIVLEVKFKSGKRSYRDLQIPPLFIRKERA